MKGAGSIVALFFFALLLQASALDAQRYEAPEPAPALDVPTQNAFYFELLGNAGAYSVNYERLIVLGPPVSFRGRIGASFFGGGFNFPLLLQFSNPLLGPVELEWGGGTTLLPDMSQGEVDNEWTALLGFRYGNIDGLLLRLGYTPFLRFNEDEESLVRHWGGFSVGMRF